MSTSAPLTLCNNIINVPPCDATATSLAQCESLFNRQMFRIIAEHGGYIAGGMARAALRGDDMYMYFNGIDASLPLKSVDIDDDVVCRQSLVRPGDIDVFFTTNEHALAAIDALSRVQYDDMFMLQVSHAGLAMNVNVPVYLFDHRHMRRSLNVQCITSFCGDPITILNGFDITNCMCALLLDHVGQPEQLLANSDVIMLEQEHTLDIRRSNSPFLLKRVHKYMTQRGLHCMTHRSRAVITDWMMRYVTRCFDDHPVAGNEAIVRTGVSGPIITQLRNINALSDDQIIMLIGAVNSISTHYTKNAAGSYELVKFNHVIDAIARHANDRPVAIA